MPWEDSQGYWAHSPLSLIGNVKTPTLVVVGSEDYRTPVSEAEQYLHRAASCSGVPTALVKVPGASHGGIAARPSQSAAKAARSSPGSTRYRKRRGAAAAASGNKRFATFPALGRPWLSAAMIRFGRVST